MTDATSLRLSTAIALATGRAPGRLTDRLSAQLHQVTVSNGRVIETLIGTLGANPRKGVTRTEADLVSALLDVAIDAMTIIQMVELERRRRVGAGGALASKLARIAERAGVAPEQEADVDPLAYGWECLLAVSSWVDSNNAHRDQEAQLWGRVSKIAEELGEATAALLSLDPTGILAADHLIQFVEESLDIAVAALGAAEHLRGNRGLVLDELLAAAKQRSTPALLDGVTAEELREALRAPRCAFTHTVYPARR